MQTQSTLCLAAQELAHVQTRYAEKGITLSQAALSGAREFVEWRHYPRNDQVDKQSGYEFYYHAHSSEEMPKGEHGHFHLFKREQKPPSGFSHLIGIALDRKGLPVRLFTANQWVTGEVFADAGKVLEALKSFDVAARGRLQPIARWLSAFTKLFFTEITTLVNERDQTLADLAARSGNRKDVLEDRKYSVLTEGRIDFMERLSQHLLVSN